MMPGPLVRSARWVWRSRSAGAWLARMALLPVAGVFSVATALRNRLYDSGRRASEPLPVPSLGIGNLAVGGTGKTPLTRGGTGIVALLEPAAMVRAGGRGETPGSLYGREVLLVAGVAEPQLLAEQLRGLGAYVRPLDLGDHHAYRAGEGEALAGQVPPGGVVVTTAKDAVKLAPLWPASAAPLLVATLQVAIESGAQALEQVLDRVATAARQQRTRGAAAASPARTS